MENERIFLLGGHDLEMLEIKTLLKKKNIDFLDHNLSWDNAKLSSYKEFFISQAEKFTNIYGVELRNDITATENYQSIDHHNDLEPRPTSLEKVAKLLGEDISDRYYQLVIHNDVGHKKGMRSICATESEIFEIRKQDRQAQGIRDDWMKTAENEIEEVIWKKDVAIIKTTLTLFTPFLDIKDFNKVIIHNDKTLSYFGAGANTVVKNHFKILLESQMTYSGGTDDGYFGITEKGFEAESIPKVINEIVKLVSINSCLSTHAFMLPLKWDYIDSLEKNKDKESKCFDDRTDLEKFNKYILESNLFWERCFFRINNNPERFNEFTYFHSFVSKAIFDLQQPDESSPQKVGKNKVMLYYEIKPNKDDYYEIHTPRKVYSLPLTGISLHVFTTGVLIVTFNMENRDFPDPADILFINEFGRRFYPQFLDVKPPYMQKTKDTFLACKITLKINGKPYTEDFTRYNSFENIRAPESLVITGRDNKVNNIHKYNQVIFAPKYLEILFNGEVDNEIKEQYKQRFVFNRDDERKGNIIRLARITDDRMFFQCWYGNNNLADEFSHKRTLDGVIDYSYSTHDYWYSFISGDKKDPTISNDLMKRDQLHKLTYTRWVGYGTVFGFSKDSFVCISSDLPTLLINNAPDISKHMQTIYYQMAVLCLAQRASVLRFSSEVSALSDLLNLKNRDPNLTEKVVNIYGNYIEFINKIYFREVSSQIQGIEMYSQFQEVMNIHADIKDLDDEIEELHSFITLLEEGRRNNYTLKLTKIAAFFAPMSLIAAMFGISFIDSTMGFYGTPKINVWISFIIIIFGGGIIGLILFYFLHPSKALINVNILTKIKGTSKNHNLIKI